MKILQDNMAIPKGYNDLRIAIMAPRLIPYSNDNGLVVVELIQVIGYVLSYHLMFYYLKK
jgi:hypothetical protein